MPLPGGLPPDPPEGCNQTGKVVKGRVVRGRAVIGRIVSGRADEVTLTYMMVYCDSTFNYFSVLELKEFGLKGCFGACRSVEFEIKM